MRQERRKGRRDEQADSRSRMAKSEKAQCVNLFWAGHTTYEDHSCGVDIQMLPWNEK